jgi:CSLREA domain-containing protein
MKKSRCRYRTSLAGFISALLLAVSAEAASLTVNSGADSGGTCPGTTCTLREAIATVASGDTINFAAGVTTITLTSGELLINKNLTINGPGANLLSVQRSTASGTPVFRIFNISNISNGTTSGLTVTISGLTIANGLAHSESGDFASNIGGGIVNNHGTLAVENCTLSGNTAAFGGGIYNQGDGGYPGQPAQAPATLTITNCTFSRNSADVYDGGAIYNDGEVGNNGKAGLATLNILNSTFSQNSAAFGGGGIYNDGISGTAPLSITDSTFSQNAGPSGGGAIYNDGTSNGNATCKIGNTILNKGGASGQNIFNASGAVTSLGYNMSDDNGSGFLTATTDQINTDPLLDTAGLKDNGGPTQTIALQSGSPAIDKGDPNAPPRDQRGYVRQNAPDIGAFEFGGVIPVTVANISTRLFVNTGDNVLIGGFIITGTEQKKVILRAIGPSLNLPGQLADPTLELYQGNTLLEANDNWMDSPNKQAIIDSTIPPSNPLESAIVRSLAPGAYTAIVRGVNNGTGIGVIQAYDLDRTVDSKLANISTRGPVQTGDNVLFAGFIVLGPDSQKVIIRALGPSVPVPGALADPTLELHDSNGAILESNDNWVDSPNKQAIIDSTIPPTNNLESAIVRILPPAAYTAIVRGVNNTTGIAVVEIYALN